MSVYYLLKKKNFKVTNEYPYNECKNAAQVYKKVSQVYTILSFTSLFFNPYLTSNKGIRPDCLKKVTNPDILDLIIRCTDVESKRISAAEVLEHRFLASDPEVLLYSMENNNLLGMKVVFNDADRLSVNFQFDRKCYLFYFFDLFQLLSSLILNFFFF